MAPASGLVKYRLVAVQQPGAAWQRDRLPSSAKRVVLGDVFHLELWVSYESTGGRLAAAYADLVFDPAALSVERVESNERYSPFDLFAVAGVDRRGGVVSAAGGARIPFESDDSDSLRWARAAVVRVRALRAGVTRLTTTQVELSPGLFGTAEEGRFGVIAGGEIDFGSLDVRVVADENGGRLRDGRPSR